MKSEELQSSFRVFVARQDNIFGGFSRLEIIIFKNCSHYFAISSHLKTYKTERIIVSICFLGIKNIFLRFFFSGNDTQPLIALRIMWSWSVGIWSRRPWGPRRLWGRPPSSWRPPRGWSWPPWHRRCRCCWWCCSAGPSSAQGSQSPAAET